MQAAALRTSRRELIKWMIATGAAGFVVDPGLAAPNAALAGGDVPRGYGLDPPLRQSYKPGEFWPLTMSTEQRKLTATLCDLILPADGPSPSATALQVDEFIDEWMSAPYPAQLADRKRVFEGLAWLDAEAQRRTGKRFGEIGEPAQAAILDDICDVPSAKSQFKAAAQFFDRFRDLVGAGYYTTREGMKDIGYVGNVPLKAYPPPPVEVLKTLGLA